MKDERVSGAGLEKELSRIGARMGEDIDGARDLAIGLLDRVRPAERIRVYAVLVTVFARKETPDAVRMAYEAGLRSGGTAVEHADLYARRAESLVMERLGDEALDLATKAVSLARAHALAARRAWGLRAKIARATLSEALIIRSQVLHLLYHQPDSAFADATEAVRWSDPAFRPKVFVAAVSYLSRLLAEHVGGPEDARKALAIVDELQELFISRRLGKRHPDLLRLYFIRALALARLGSTARAEQILMGVVEGFREAGLESDMQVAAEHLVWIVAKRSGDQGRARYIARRLGTKVPAEAVAEDDDEPIGF